VESAWSARDGEPSLAEAGETAALQRAFPVLPASTARLLGPGDDAAVVEAPDGRFVVTSDSMIEGPDFRQAWTGPADLGWKLVATNLADIAAMGARPTALVVSLGLPPGVRVSVMEELAAGMRDACAALAPGCGIEGGDLARSPIIMAVATAFGDLEGRSPVRRSGARPGDVVAVSGRLGAAAEGLALLFARAVAGEPAIPSPAAFADLRAASSEPERSALDAQLRPRPPVADGVLAAEAGATALIDLSDGLALDASRIATASGVGIVLDSGLVRAAAGGRDEPRSNGRPAVADALAWEGARLERLLAGGEDHALLAAFPPDVPLPGGFQEIGRVVTGSGLLVDGEPYAGRGGWDPFVP